MATQRPKRGTREGAPKGGLMKRLFPAELFCCALRGFGELLVGGLAFRRQRRAEVLAHPGSHLLHRDSRQVTLDRRWRHRL